MTIQWLRRLIRRNTKRIDEPTADFWKRRLSIAYGFLAWNAFALVCYAFINGKRDWAAYHGLEVDKASPGNSTSALQHSQLTTFFVFPLPAMQFARMMDIPKAKVIRISGLKTETFEIDDTEKDSYKE